MPRKIIRPIGPSIAYVELTRGDCALIDSDSLEIVSGSTWWSGSGTNAHYARNAETIMHRLIVGAKCGEVVDHMNGNTMDNRRVNLRICTHEQNMQNRAMSKANQSGLLGVTRKKNCVASWGAEIQAGGKRYKLGTYPSPELAHTAYLKAKSEFHISNTRPAD